MCFVIEDMNKSVKFIQTNNLIPEFLYSQRRVLSAV